MRTTVSIALLVLLVGVGVGAFLLTRTDERPTASVRATEPARESIANAPEHPIERAPAVDGGPLESAPPRATTEAVGTPSSAPESAPATAQLGDLLFAGRVVDTEGRAVPDAGITVVRLHRFEDGGDERWIATDLGADAQADGRFEVHGRERAPGDDDAPSPERFGLRARAERYVEGEPLACRPGDLDLRVVLVAAGSIEGELSHSGPLATVTQVRIRAVPRGDAAGALAREARIDGERLDGARFTIDGLTPGAWTVTLRTAAGQDIARIEDVQVNGGERTRDPRLSPWRFEIDGFVVDVVHPDGSPAADAELRIVRRSANHAIAIGAPRIAPGSFLVLGEPEGVTLRATCPGARTETLEGVRVATRVVLRPTYEVRVEFENLPELEHAGERLALHFFRPLELDPAVDRNDAVLVLSPSAPHTLRFADSGEYTWQWEALDASGSVVGIAGERGAPTMRVQNLDAPQTLRIRAPDDLWSEMIDLR